MVIKYKSQHKCALIVAMQCCIAACRRKARPFKLPSLEALAALAHDRGGGGVRTTKLPEKCRGQVQPVRKMQGQVQPVLHGLPSPAHQCYSLKQATYDLGGGSFKPTGGHAQAMPAALP